MANTDAQNSPQQLQAGYPGPGDAGFSEFYQVHVFTDVLTMPGFMEGDELEPPPTTGWIYPRGILT